jgi:hypothetical protein
LSIGLKINAAEYLIAVELDTNSLESVISRVLQTGTARKIEQTLGRIST